MGNRHALAVGAASERTRAAMNTAENTRVPARKLLLRTAFLIMLPLPSRVDDAFRSLCQSGRQRHPPIGHPANRTTITTKEGAIRSSIAPALPPTMTRWSTAWTTVLQRMQRNIVLLRSRRNWDRFSWSGRLTPLSYKPLKTWCRRWETLIWRSSTTRSTIHEWGCINIKNAGINVLNIEE